jgi:hypothetical protein
VNKLFRRGAAGTLALTLIAGAALTFPGAITANDRDVIREGSCSGRSDWKIKQSPENGRIEVEFEVDSNVPGQTWNVRLKKNGNIFFTGQRTTGTRSGSFEVRRVVNNGAGAETIVGRAVNPKTGEVCRGEVTANL